MFSPILWVVFSFYFMYFFFAMKKLLSFIICHLFISLFIFITLGGQSKKKKIAAVMSQCVLPVFPSKSFIVCSFTFRSLIHFELILVDSVRECSNFIPCSRPIFPSTFIEETVFSPLYILGSSVID